MKTTQKILLNIIFILLCGSILLFLLSAPKKRTKPLPQDKKHAIFQNMKKKEAEPLCHQCHATGQIAALPSQHPPPNRCLFCHQRQAKQ